MDFPTSGVSTSTSSTIKVSCDKDQSGAPAGSPEARLYQVEKTLLSMADFVQQQQKEIDRLKGVVNTLSQGKGTAAPMKPVPMSKEGKPAGHRVPLRKNQKQLKLEKVKSFLTGEKLRVNVPKVCKAKLTKHHHALYNCDRYKDDVEKYLDDLEKGMIAKHKRPLSRKDFLSMNERSHELIDIHDYQNVQYFGDLFVGSNAQRFTVIYDTGSSTVWVPSAASHLIPSTINKYDHNKSSTYEKDGKPFYLVYGSGPVCGIFSKDTMAIGHAPHETSTGDYAAHKYTFGEVLDTTGLGDAYKLGKFDGLVGLGWPNLGSTYTTPLLVELFNKKIIENPVFTFKLARRHGEDGELTLGFIDDDAYSGPIYYEDVITKKYWDFEIKYVYVANSKSDNKYYTSQIEGDRGLILDATQEVRGSIAVGKRVGMVDSGTSLFAAPLDDIRALADLVGASPLKDEPSCFAVRADQVKNLPVMVIVSSNNIQYVLKGTDYTNDIGMGYYMLSFSAMDSPSHDNLPQMWILGDPFMRNYYSVFDYGNARVGLALAN